jgi:hypothetical protein
MFLIENIRKRGDWYKFPGEGLVIWHIDKKGNNDYQDMTAAKHYITSIEQADGKFDMEKNLNSGDAATFSVPVTRTSLMIPPCPTQNGGTELRPDSIFPT